MIKSPHIETLLVSQTAHKEVFISGAGELCISELITENGKPVSFEIRKIETVDDLLPAGSEKECFQAGTHASYKRPLGQRNEQ